jgi:hypothetical protein
MANRGRPGHSGVTFGPNTSGKLYLSDYRHRGNGDARYKSFWLATIPASTEFEIFCVSDTKNLLDEDGNLFGCLDDGETEIGTKGEVLCKFWNPHNQVNPWHGHRVSPSLRSADEIKIPTVQQWIDSQSITRTFGRSIQRGEV